MNSREKALALLVTALVLTVSALVVREFRQAPPAAVTAPVPPITTTKPGFGPRLDAAVLERAKAATVFVQVRNVSYLDGAVAEEGSGTGFFISPDGRVATSWHVVSALKNLGGISVPLRSGDIKVIVRSGARDQKVLPARLLAADSAADLAVLKVDAENCPWLPLGDSAELVETAPLWVLGFPLGKLFSVLQRGPELSVNGGAVSSLRHNDLGELRSVQFDAVVIKGNSGGPVIAPDGRVMGVANMALGTSRVNFAIPVARLKKLLAECPADKKVGESCLLRVSSEPQGAKIWLDSRPLGTAPLEVRVPGGWGRVVAALPGRRSWSQNLAIYDGRRVRARLEPLAELKLQTFRAGAAPARGGTPMKRGAKVFAEDFTDRKAADDWKQDTGGSDQRTWYVEQGALRQFSDDAMLHAVFAGQEKWTDYAFSARVRIGPNQKDGRAGLIFRSTADGFALFRLHRASSKVQLAYHSNAPFGWRILDERELPFKVKGDTWYAMQVQVLGDQIACLLDGKVVLAATVQQPLGGKVGFYSVDSRAAFDDARVTRVSAGQRKPGRKALLRAFWFTTQFAEDCGYWRAFRVNAPAAPWPVTAGGCLHLDESATEAANMLTRYDVHGDVLLNALVSGRSGSVGLVFRRKGKRYYLFTVNRARSSARLFLVDGGKKKQLAASGDPSMVRNALRIFQERPAARQAAARPGGALLRDIFSMFVTARGNRIRAGVNGQPLLEAVDGTLSNGRIGLYADRTRGIFHRLDVASVGPQPVPAQPPPRQPPRPAPHQKSPKKPPPRAGKTPWKVGPCHRSSSSS